MRYRIVLIGLFVLGHHLLMAQSSLSVKDAGAFFTEGLQLYEAKKYGAARNHFEEFQKRFPGDVERGSQAAFYLAVSAKLLENPDAMLLMTRFIADYPTSNFDNEMFYHLGDYYLLDNDYSEALTWFSKVQPRLLSRTLSVDAIFKTGYCHFMEGDKKKALSYFNQLKGREGKYASSISYYQAHVDYENGKYDVALPVFLSLESDAGFKKVVPYYIAQIYYLQGNYDEAIRYAEPLIDGSKGDRSIDMARVVGDSYFQKKEYAKAASFYQIIFDQSKKIKREDYYHMGYCRYVGRDYAQAAELLSQVTSGEDAMAQNAYYHLADCYLKMNDKKRARVAFEAAARFDFDKKISEDASFNFLKLNYELAFSPFNEIINSFLAFIEKYPDSPYIDQAYDYLGKAFVTSKNYREALLSMEKIKNKNQTVYKGMQRLAFYRGVELFIDLKYEDAIYFFDYSLKYGEFDRLLKARAHYWRGESNYRLGRFEVAQNDYQQFVNSPGAQSLNEYNTAHYNMGYVFFNLKNYPRSIEWFRKYTGFSAVTDKVMLADAYNRLGDCYFVDRGFQPAIDNYRKAASTALTAADYAMFQESFCLGLLRDHNGKINNLKQLISRYPQSPYCDDAYFEIARAYVALNQLDDAIFNFKLVKDRFPKGTLAPKAMLQLGLLYYNRSDYENAMAFYKRVVNEYPRTSDATEALAGLRNIYMDKSDFDGYMTYTSTLGDFARIDNVEQDSLLYVSAERLYLRGEFKQALPAFQKYLQALPAGRFALNAYYYLGDCFYREQNQPEALRLFTYVADQPRNLFTEDALLRQGELLYASKDYSQAVVSFERLEKESELEDNRVEAIIGQMRSQKMLGDFERCVSIAAKVMALPKVAPEILREAQYLNAQSLLELGRRDAAMPLLKQLMANTKSVEGAEAKYLYAFLLNETGKDEAAEKVVFDYIEEGTPHQYWLARSFVLLSDIYHNRKEDFQAIQYLESLKANYSGDDDIQSMIEERLSQWRKATETESVNDGRVDGVSVN